MRIRQQLVKSTKNISLNPNARRTITVHETGNRGAGADARAPICPVCGVLTGSVSDADRH